MRNDPEKQVTSDPHPDEDARTPAWVYVVGTLVIVVALALFGMHQFGIGSPLPGGVPGHH
jgi:hypothetical protein